MRLLASVPPGLEPVTVGELERLGAARIESAHGAVFFDGDLELMVRANLELRSASRILDVLFHAQADAPEASEVFASLPWAQRLRDDRDVVVHVQDAARDNTASQREALALQRLVHDRVRPVRKPTTEDPHAIVIRVHRHKDRLTVGLDTSGSPLHQRGWKSASSHRAPLKENVAAGLLLALGYDGSDAFVDACCGSGTAVIEAAYIAIDKAPLMHRAKGWFAFEWLRDFDSKLLRACQDAARARRRPRPSHAVLGIDLEPRFAFEARKTAEHARIGHHVAFAIGDVRHAPLRGSGTLFANLPYGARLEDVERARALAQNVGARLGDDLAAWRAGILLPTELVGDLGRTPSSTLRVRNGAIECTFAIFAPRG